MYHRFGWEITTPFFWFVVAGTFIVLISALIRSGRDSIVPIIQERMNTYQETRPLAVLNKGKELIHWSERDGWAHLYLYDDQGNLKNRITKGPWHVEQVLKVDEATRTIYFVGNGKEEGENPYYEQLYKVNVNGSGLETDYKGGVFFIK